MAISGHAILIKNLWRVGSYFITAGENHLRMWSILRDKRKLVNHDINMGKQQRKFVCGQVDVNDEYAYFGTTTGDLVKVVLKCCDPDNVTAVGEYARMIGSYGVHDIRKPLGKDCIRYVNGIQAISLVGKGLLVIGSGDGTLELVEERTDVDARTFKNYPNPTWPMLRRVNYCNHCLLVTFG